MPNHRRIIAAWPLQARAEGADADQWSLVVGLIDYCRQYTWKEDAESRVKRATVIPPRQYKRRFREALNRYFIASAEKYVEQPAPEVALTVDHPRVGSGW